jgi:hypothetical protein
MAVIRKDFNYKKIPNFMSKEELKIYQEYCLNKLNFLETAFSTDVTSPYSPFWCEDSLIQVLLQQKLPLVENVTGLKLFKTYCYWRYYGFGATLSTHADRPSCEITVTVCINKTDNWPLIIDGKEIELDIGDGLVYLGVEVPHSRPEMFRGDGMAQCLLHYVDQKGPFTHHKDDNYFKTTGFQKPPGDIITMEKLINEQRKKI